MRLWIVGIVTVATLAGHATEMTAESDQAFVATGHQAAASNYDSSQAGALGSIHGYDESRNPAGTAGTPIDPRPAEGGGELAARGGAGPVRLGQAGETAAGITKNTTSIPSALSPGRNRIPDVLDPRAGVLGEVKNVGYQSYSSQLRDYAAIAQREGYAFQLTVRPTTTLSGPLQQEVRSGAIQLRYLP